MKTSKNIRYDKESKLWIKHRKRIYLWWYKFLQIAIQENRKINHQFYRGWGDTSLKFDDWWKKNWKRLFGVKKEKDIPLVHLDSIALKANAYKHRYKVYVLNKQGLSHYEIIKKVNKIKGYSITDDKDSDGGDGTNQCRHYLSQAKKMINNICKGIFP
jgi:hypothetical protein